MVFNNEAEIVCLPKEVSRSVPVWFAALSTKVQLAAVASSRVFVERAILFFACRTGSVIDRRR